MHPKLTGEAALLLVECDEEEWKKHLRKEDGKWVICVLCQRATHGTMNAASLTHKKLARLWNQWGLTMIPCDPCVHNGLIDGEKFTVMFHADDLLRSHESPAVATEMTV